MSDDPHNLRRKRERRDSPPPGASTDEMLRRLEAQIEELQTSRDAQLDLEANRRGAGRLAWRVTGAFGGLLTAILIGAFVWVWNSNVQAQVQADRVHRMTEQFGEITARAQVSREVVSGHSQDIALGAQQDREILRRLDVMEETAETRNREIMGALRPRRRR